MKKLLLIMILILSFIGCKDEDKDWQYTGAPKKGAKFKVYSYQDKLEIARKVSSKEKDPDKAFPQSIYPKVVEEYMENQDILESENRYGNEKASQELKEWDRAFSEIGYIPIKHLKSNN